MIASILITGISLAIYFLLLALNGWNFSIFKKIERPSEFYSVTAVNIYYKRKHQQIIDICNGTIIPILLGAVIFGLCANIAISCNEKTVLKYQTQYESYTQILGNETLGTYEKACIVDEVIDFNTELAIMQHNATKWYGVFIPDEVAEIPLVDLSKEP